MKYTYQITISLIAFLVFLNIVFFAKSISLGDSIEKIEQKTQQLSIENTELQKKVLSQNSLEELSKKAQALGFIKQAQPINLNTFNTVALAQ